MHSKSLLIPLTLAVAACAGSNFNMRTGDQEQKKTEAESETEADKTREEIIYLLSNLFGGSMVEAGFARVPQESVQCELQCAETNNETTEACDECKDKEQARILNESGVNDVTTQLHQAMEDSQSPSCNDLTDKVRERIRQMGGKDKGNLFPASGDCDLSPKKEDVCLIYKPNPPRKWELPSGQAVITSTGQIIKKKADRETGKPVYYSDGQKYLRFTVKSTKGPFKGAWSHRSRMCE